MNNFKKRQAKQKVQALKGSANEERRKARARKAREAREKFLKEIAEKGPKEIFHGERTYGNSKPLVRKEEILQREVLHGKSPALRSRIIEHQRRQQAKFQKLKKSTEATTTEENKTTKFVNSEGEE